MIGPSVIALALGTSDKRLQFLMWCSEHIGETVNRTECCDAYGGSGAVRVIAALLDAGLFVDCSGPGAGPGCVPSRYYSIEPHDAWDIIDDVVDEMALASV